MVGKELIFGALMALVGASCAGGSPPETEPRTAGVHDGDVTITDRASFSALAGVTEVMGTLAIDGADVSAIPDLEKLTRVEGDLRITRTSLADLRGLDALGEVGGFLWIESNAALTTLRGIGHLDSTGWSTVIRSNDALVDLNGLESLSSIGGQLSIVDDVALQDIDALGSLTTLGDNLNVYNDFALPQCPVDELEQRLLDNGWSGSATINGLVACDGRCRGTTCGP